MGIRNMVMVTMEDMATVTVLAITVDITRTALMVMGMVAMEKQSLMAMLTLVMAMDTRLGMAMDTLLVMDTDTTLAMATVTLLVMAMLTLLVTAMDTLVMVMDTLAMDMDTPELIKATGIPRLQAMDMLSPHMVTHMPRLLTAMGMLNLLMATLTLSRLLVMLSLPIVTHITNLVTHMPRLSIAMGIIKATTAMVTVNMATLSTVISKAIIIKVMAMGTRSDLNMLDADTRATTKTITTMMTTMMTTTTMTTTMMIITMTIITVIPRVIIQTPTTTINMILTTKNTNAFIRSHMAGIQNMSTAQSKKS